MANGYRAWYSTSEQEWITQLDEFLINIVGWYRIFTHSPDSSTDRRYTWMSEGDSNDKRPPRLISARGFSNLIQLDCLLADVFNYTTGGFGSPYLGASSDSEFSPGNTPGKCRTVASKDRIFVTLEPTVSRFTGYAGFIDSFYSPVDDPNPVFIRGQPLSYNDWTDGQTRMLDANGVEADYSINFNLTAVAEGYPNTRNGKLSFFRPIVYLTTPPELAEVRGRLKGVYYGRPDRLALGSFVDIDGEYYLVTKTSDEIEAILAGPVSSNGEVPVNYGWMPRPNLEVNYAQRGLELDVAVSGTLALWRFDTGHLNNYVYGSGSVLPVPGSYPDATGVYTLTPQNNLTSVQSRLNEAANFDGSTHYAVGTGDAASAAALKDEWTFECIFKPDVIPTASARATLVDYSTAGATAAENILLRVSVSPAVGITTDAYNVGRGNIEISWEEGTASVISNVTTTDFVQQNRWNYLAIVKKFNGSNYDIDVWHCSFGDHVVPVKKATFINVNNASSGTNSDWYIGATEATTNYFDGSIDDTRITARVLTNDEIINNCFRTML